MNLNKCINKFPTKQRLSTWERRSHPNLSIQCPQSPSLTHSLWDWRNLMLTNLLTLSPSPNNPAGQKRVLNYQNRLASHSRVQWGHQRRYWIGNQAMREREWRNRYKHQSRKLQRKLILLMNMMNSLRKRISKGSPKTNLIWEHPISSLSQKWLQPNLGTFLLSRLKKRLKIPTKIQRLLLILVRLNKSHPQHLRLLADLVALTKAVKIRNAQHLASLGIPLRSQKLTLMSLPRRKKLPKKKKRRKREKKRNKPRRKQEERSNSLKRPQRDSRLPKLNWPRKKHRYSKRSPQRMMTMMTIMETILRKMNNSLVLMNMLMMILRNMIPKWELVSLIKRLFWARMIYTKYLPVQLVSKRLLQPLSRQQRPILQQSSNSPKYLVQR